MARQRYCRRLTRYRNTQRVSADPVAKPAAQTRAESRVLDLQTRMRERDRLSAGGRWIRTSSTAAREPIAILRRACPTHARLGEKDGQRGAHPYVFYRLGVDWSSPENRVHDEAIDLEFELDRV